MSPLIDAWANALTGTVWAASAAARARRAQLFRHVFELDERTSLLDIGTQGCEHIARVLAGTRIRPENVVVADIDPALVLPGARLHGFTPAVISPTGQLPFADKTFDIVFCSSVIEHATVPKPQVWQLTDGRRFRRAARRQQWCLAREIRRVGRGYFVQTPDRSFPIESHTWLPLVGYLPRPLLVPLIGIANRLWIKTTEPDWHLLGVREMARLFPDAEIRREGCLGMSKSLMAIRRTHRPGAPVDQSDAQRPMIL